MKRLFHALAVLALLAAPAGAQTEMSREALEHLSTHYRFFATLPDDADGRMRYIYADEGPHLHAYTVEKGGRSVLDWETNVGSLVRGLQLVTTREGQLLIVIATSTGKLFAYDANDYDLVRENLMEPFTALQAMVVAELDNEGVKEVVLLGTKEGEDKPHLFVYDGYSSSLEWRTQETFSATEILVANLDDDKQPEIILNTGTVIDSRFRTIDSDFLQEGGFGTRLQLLDINGDGFPEIFGTTLGDQIRVYDPYAGRRLW
jgi:hypothetical protein